MSGGRARRRTRAAPELFGLLISVIALASSTGSVAVPDIAERFGSTGGTAAWSISLYLLAVAVSTVIYGRLSDLVGVRLPLLTGFALVSCGAGLAAAAPSFPLLLVGRVVQGLGAGAFPALAVTALGRLYDGHVPQRAFARMTGVASGLSGLGPLLGGVVTGVLGWRAVMALPVLALLVLPFVWHRLSTTGTGVGLDLVGALLVSATTAGLIALIQSPTTGLPVALVGVALLVTGGLCLPRWVRRRPEGFLPVSVLTNITVVRSALVASSVFVVLFAQLVGLPLVLVELGWPAWRIGLLFLPAVVVSVGAARLVARAIVRLGPRRCLTVAALTSAVSALVLVAGIRTEATPILILAIVLATVGLVIGQPSLAAAVNDATSRPVRGAAHGLSAFLFMVGSSVGSAIVAGLAGAIGAIPTFLVVAFVPAAASVLTFRRGPAEAATAPHDVPSCVERE